MIILNKKRMGIILASILIGIFAFSFKIGDSNESGNNTPIGSTVQVSSTPVSGKVVVLDAGHRSARRRGKLTALSKKVTIPL